MIIFLFFINVKYYMSAKEYYLLDYLQSTGNQHINTGLTTKAKYWVDGDFSFDKNVSNYMFIFGV